MLNTNSVGSREVITLHVSVGEFCLRLHIERLIEIQTIANLSGQPEGRVVIGGLESGAVVECRDIGRQAANTANEIYISAAIKET